MSGDPLLRNCKQMTFFQPFATIGGDVLLQCRMPQHLLVRAKVSRVKKGLSVAEAEEEEDGTGAVICLNQRHSSPFDLEGSVDWSGEKQGGGNPESGTHQVGRHFTGGWMVVGELEEREERREGKKGGRR